MLARHGYGVLLMNRRGEGDSEGDTNLFGWADTEDIAGAVGVPAARGGHRARRDRRARPVGGRRGHARARLQSDDLAAVVSEGIGSRSIKESLELSGGIRIAELTTAPLLTGGVVVFSDQAPPPNLVDVAKGLAPARRLVVWGEDGQPAEKVLGPTYAEAAGGAASVVGGPGRRAHPRHRRRPGRVRAPCHRLLRLDPAPRAVNRTTHEATRHNGGSYERNTRMSASLITRLAGPAAIAAGALMVSAQLVLTTFDVTKHVETSTNPLFQVTQVFYLLGFIALMVFLFATSRWFEEKGGKFGVFATLAALVGTMALGGDMWFETFAIPWIADEVPGAFDTDPTVVLGLGALSSYLLMAIGWALYGIASYRARIFPRALSVALVIGGLLAFNALLAPYGIALGLAVGAVGIWVVRNTSRADREVTEVHQPVLVA